MTRKGLLLFGLSAVLAVSTAQIANAGFFVPGMAGYGTFGNFAGVPSVLSAAADGTVSFAVYERTDPNWTNDAALAGLGAIVDQFDGSVHTNAKYVYFYQVVNTDPLPSALGDNALDTFFDIYSALGTVTGAGYVAGTVFDDGAPISIANPGLGIGGGAAGDVDPTSADGIPSSVYGGVVAFSSVAGVVPTGVAVLPGSVEFQFSAPAIASTASSTIVFITSNYKPEYIFGTLTDTGATDGNIPSPGGTLGSVVPEPSSVVMLLGTFAAGLAAVWAKNRRKANNL